MVAELIRYIKAQTAQGATREQLISHLVDYGWSEEVVRELMDDIIEPPSAPQFKKYAIPSLSLITLVAIFGFIVSNNAITGTSIYENPVCLYTHSAVIEKIPYPDCCEAGITNCREVLSSYYINDNYLEFDYVCDYKEGTLTLSREIVKNCGLSVT